MRGTGLHNSPPNMQSLWTPLYAENHAVLQFTVWLRMMENYWRMTGRGALSKRLMSRRLLCVISVLMLSSRQRLSPSAVYFWRTTGCSIAHASSGLLCALMYQMQVARISAENKVDDTVSLLSENRDLLIELYLESWQKWSAACFWCQGVGW